MAEVVTNLRLMLQKENNARISEQNVLDDIYFKSLIDNYNGNNGAETSIGLNHSE